MDSLSEIFNGRVKGVENKPRKTFKEISDRGIASMGISRPQMSFAEKVGMNKPSMSIHDKLSMGGGKMSGKMSSSYEDKIKMFSLGGGHSSSSESKMAMFTGISKAKERAVPINEKMEWFGMNMPKPNIKGVEMNPRDKVRMFTGMHTSGQPMMPKIVQPKVAVPVQNPMDKIRSFTGASSVVHDNAIDKIRMFGGMPTGMPGGMQMGSPAGIQSNVMDKIKTFGGMPGGNPVDRVKKMMGGPTVYNDNLGFQRAIQQQRLPGRNVMQRMFGDADGDGKMNILDCEPFNRKKQDTIDPTLSGMAGGAEEGDNKGYVDYEQFQKAYENTGGDDLKTSKYTTDVFGRKKKEYKGESSFSPKLDSKIVDLNIEPTKEEKVDIWAPKQATPVYQRTSEEEEAEIRRKLGTQTPAERLSSFGRGAVTVGKAIKTALTPKKQMKTTTPQNIINPEQFIDTQEIKAIESSGLPPKEKQAAYQALATKADLFYKLTRSGLGGLGKTKDVIALENKVKAAGLRKQYKDITGKPLFPDTGWGRVDELGWRMQRNVGQIGSMFSPTGQPSPDKLARLTYLPGTGVEGMIKPMRSGVPNVTGVDTFGDLSSQLKIAQMTGNSAKIAEIQNKMMTQPQVTMPQMTQMTQLPQMNEIPQMQMQMAPPSMTPISRPRQREPSYTRVTTAPKAGYVSSPYTPRPVSYIRGPYKKQVYAQTAAA